MKLPSYKNFKGVIHELGQNQFMVSGEVSVLDKNTIEIIELPVRTWTQVGSPCDSPPPFTVDDMHSFILRSYQPY